MLYKILEVTKLSFYHGGVNICFFSSGITIKQNQLKGPKSQQQQKMQIPILFSKFKNCVLFRLNCCHLQSFTKLNLCQIWNKLEMVERCFSFLVQAVSSPGCCPPSYSGPCLPSLPPSLAEDMSAPHIVP